ncbi:DUF916 domain-containing protein [Patescibacteria group bacterium]|nr:DUF916 domain-containing protein [Patescibacteria group bacterium]
MTKKALTLVFSSLLTLALTVSAAFAVGVKPVRTELTIDPGGSASATIRVINSENVPITVRPEVTIYTKNDEEGFPVAAEDLPADHPMNIRDWIEFPAEDLSLEPNSEKEVTFKVNVPADAQPGGKYASIIYTSVDDAASGEVKVQVAVPSLILVKVTGEEIHSGEVLSFGVKNGNLLGDQNPILAVSFQNNGNVHEKPSGSVTLTDSMTGEQLTQIARYYDDVSGELIIADAIPLNLTGGNVLPGSSRTFTAEWNENIRSGKFIAVSSLKYGSEPTIATSAEIEINEDLQLNSFEINQLEASTDFTITLTNNGNVYEKLEGKIEIINDFESVVASVPIPEDAGYIVASLSIPENVGYIAPGATAKITVPWLEKQVPAGKYTAKLAAFYGFENASLESEVQFVSAANNLPYYFAIGGGVIVLLLIAVIIFRKKEVKKEMLNEEIV